MGALYVFVHIQFISKATNHPKQSQHIIIEHADALSLNIYPVIHMNNSQKMVYVQKQLPVFQEIITVTAMNTLFLCRWFIRVSIKNKSMVAPRESSACAGKQNINGIPIDLWLKQIKTRQSLSIMKNKRKLMQTTTKSLGQYILCTIELGERYSCFINIVGV